jgi:hypothetical protein
LCEVWFDAQPIAQSSKIEMKLYAVAFRTYNDDIPAAAASSALKRTEFKLLMAF